MPSNENIQSIHTKKEVIIIPANYEHAKEVKRTKLLKVAAYCRVSTDLEDQQSSFEAQQTYYTDKILSNNEWTMAGIYADEGISGTTAEKRKEFIKMINQCNQGKIDLILTKSISRFSRNTLDSIKYIRALKSKGIGVIFEKENINTMNLDNELMLTMFSAFAQGESESISRNVKWGKREGFKQGKVCYQYKNWYGYKKGENEEPEIVPKEAEVIERIFNDFLTGDSMGEIVKSLNAENIKPKRGNKWSTSTIKNLLQNEKCCGDVILQKTYVADCIEKKTLVNNGELPKYLIKNAHEGIISREMFDMAQEELSKRNSRKKVSEISSKTEHSKYSGKYALTGLIVCGNCGSVYRRQKWTNRDKTKKAVWRCLKRLDYGTKYCDCSPTLEEQKIKDAVMEAIHRVFKDNAGLTEILSKNLMETLTEKKEDENPYVLKKRLKELEDTMMSLVAFSAKAGESERFDIRFKKISDDMIHIRDKISKSEITGKDKRSEKKAESVIEKFKKSKDVLNEYDDRIVRMIVEEIMVMGEDRLVVFIKGEEEIEVKIKY